MGLVQFEWDKFLPTLENDFLDMLNEVLCHNANSSTPKENRNQYNTVINNRTLETPGPPTTYTNRTCGHHHISHSMPENNSYGGNGHLTSNMYLGYQNRGQHYHTAQSRSSHTDGDQ